MDFIDSLHAELRDIEAAGLFKREREIASPQGEHVTVGGEEFVNLCANNYLGLAGRPQARTGRERRDRQPRAGHGPRCASSAARPTIHCRPRTRARGLSRHGRRDPLRCLFRRQRGAFRAASGGAEDAVVSDALNHASIIDGIRLVEGAAVPLPQRRHGRSRSTASRGAGRRGRGGS